MKSVSINGILKEHMSFLEERDWLRLHTPSMVIISLVTELGELLEHMLWKKDDEIVKYSEQEQKRALIGEEMADVMLNIIELSYHLHIDLSKEVQKKIASNRAKYDAKKWHGKMANEHLSSYK